MAQRMVQETVYANDTAYQLPGIFRLAAGLVRLPFLIVRAIAAGVLVGLRIFISTAEQVGSPQ